MKIKKFFKTYWKKTEIKKWDYLFKNNENDTNLYYILDWEVLLTNEWIDIIITWKNEIIWEKSFINNAPKPINAIAVKDTNILVISQYIFKKIDNNEKTTFLKQLILLVSDRVYLLNEIINNIAKIWEKISNNKINLSTLSIWNIFTNLIKIKNIYVYKKISWWIIPLYESNINTDFIAKNQKIIENNKIIQIDEKYVTNTWNYIFIFDWEKLKSDYIINNVLMHTINSIEYLWLLIEEEKNKILKSFLDD